VSELEPSGHFLVYVDKAGQAKIDVRFDGDTVWLTAEAISKDFLQVRQQGSRQVKRTITHYNLDMIISVGYRVKSRTATAFRIWATQRLREFIVKDFVLRRTISQP
jgi:hypothetical protein